MTVFRTGLCALLVALVAWPSIAGAEVRAWLDRTRIGADESATLNIETTELDARPDYAPLAPRFSVGNMVSTRSFERVGGTSRARMLYAVTLQPTATGTQVIPALAVGSAKTAPLALEVAGARPVAAAREGAAFVEAEIDTPSPWVQQSVGYVVRLYYGVSLVSGELLQPEPEGASLRQVGSDVQYERQVGGRRYTVVERRFLLVPERSGPLRIPAAQFRGRGVGNVFDDLFGNGQRLLSADGPARTVTVRAIPAGAPQPWLPLRALSLRYLEAPRTARAGEAAEVVVEAEVDGAAAAQAPELRIEAPPGAQVFADPPQVVESMDGGRPSLRIVRRFSLVPAQAGPLQVAGPSIGWWDTQAGRARETSLPDLALQVSAAAGTPAGSVPDDADDGARSWIRIPGVQGAMQPWAMGTVVFALLWLLTLAWGLSRRPAPPRRGEPDAHGVDDTVADARTTTLSPRHLRDAIDTRTPGEIVALLQSLATPPVHDVDALRARLSSAAQVAALDALERARWHDGDLASARQEMRLAFADGPRWHAAPAAPRRSRDALPPLYVER